MVGGTDPCRGWWVASIVAIFGVVRGIFTAGAKFKGLPGSVEIRAADQPVLFAEIADVASTMRMDMPDRVFVVHDVNAFVLEDTRFLGLLTKQRIMGIGLPLLDSFSVDEIRGRDRTRDGALRQQRHSPRTAGVSRA